MIVLLKGKCVAKFKVAVSGVSPDDAKKVIDRLLSSKPELLSFSELPVYRTGEVVAEVNYPEITCTLEILGRVKNVFGIHQSYSPSVGQPIFV